LLTLLLNHWPTLLRNRWPSVSRIISWGFEIGPASFLREYNIRSERGRKFEASCPDFKINHLQRSHQLGGFFIYGYRKMNLAIVPLASANSGMVTFRF
jgi:hypothetical protein